MPVPPGVLAEKTHRRVPGAVGSRKLPAPVGNELESHPYRAAERSGEVRDRGVRSDDEVEAVHRCGGIEKGIRPGIEIVAKRLNPHRNRKALQLYGAFVFLQANQADPWDGG